MARRSVLALCGGCGLLGAVVLALAPPNAPRLLVLLFFWGGIAAGIYPVALGMAGDRFRGGELVSANAAMITAYGLGALAGPALGGAAMDGWNPNGLFGLFVVLFAVFVAATLFRRPRATLP
jgi:MFS family permease